MAVNNPLTNKSYINQDFVAIYNELLETVKQLGKKWDPTISNESDPGVILLKADAIIGDKDSYNRDKNTLENFPETLTQEFSARSVYGSLGYNMPWYKSATTVITLTWKDSIDAGTKITIPKYTMVTDADNSIVYTLTQEVEFTSDNVIATCPAIQGIIQTLSVNGNETVQIDNLDDNNRIYIEDTTVAQNGIFITNVSNTSAIQNVWAKVDNLFVEQLGNYYYEFGVDARTGNCYVQFPEDIDTLIGEGLSIKYVLSDGVEGNVTAKTITQFYDDSSATLSGLLIESKKVSIDKSNCTVYNASAAKNGENPQTIEEAGKEYKRTLGTFYTLVTLRDYINAIHKLEQVSNDFVTDRYTDIQSCYTVATDTNNSGFVKIQEPIEGSDNVMTAYELKICALKNIGVITSVEDYETTFNVIPSQSQDMDNIKAQIEATKCISHDFVDIEPDVPCMFKVSYPLRIKIVPQQKLTAAQELSMKLNIMAALFNSLNSSKIEFGDEPNYDYIYNSISTCDERIKLVIIDDFVYTIYATYWDKDSSQFKSVPVSKLDTVGNVIYFNETFDTAEAKFKAAAKKLTNPESYDYVCDDSADSYNLIEFTYTDGTQGKRPELYPGLTITSDAKTYITFNGETTRPGSYTVAPVIPGFGSYETEPRPNAYDLGPGTYLLSLGLDAPVQGISARVKISRSDHIIMFSKIDQNGSFTVEEGDYFNTLGLVIDFKDDVRYDNVTLRPKLVKRLSNSSNPEVYKYNSEKEEFTLYSDTILNIRNDILSKSIIAGKTPLFKYRDLFTRNLAQKVSYNGEINNVSRLTTDLKISPWGYTEDNTLPQFDIKNNQASYTLKSNESLQFFAPSLIADQPYASGVIYQLVLANSTGIEKTSASATKLKYDKETHTAVYSPDVTLWVLNEAFSYTPIKAAGTDPGWLSEKYITPVYVSNYFYKKVGDTYQLVTDSYSETKVNKPTDWGTGSYFYDDKGQEPVVFKSYTQTFYDMWANGDLSVYIDAPVYRIEANTEYKLHNGDYLTLFWVEEDSEGSPYVFKCLKGINPEQETETTKSPIIKASFTLTGTKLSDATINPSIMKDSGYIPFSDEPSSTFRRVKSMSTQALTGSKTIETRKINEVKLQKNNSYIYFVTNNIVIIDNTEYYKMVFTRNENGQYDYVLKSGELFLRTWDNNTSSEVSSNGTLIRIYDNNLTEDTYELKVYKIPSTTVSTYGLSSYLDSALLVTQDILVREQQIYNFVEKDTILITLHDNYDANKGYPVFETGKLTTVKGFDVSYSQGGGTYEQLPTINIEDDEAVWKGSATLNINSSYNTPQVINNKYTVTAGSEIQPDDILKQSIQTIIVGNDQFPYSPYRSNVTELLSKTVLNLTGGKNIDVSYLDGYGEPQNQDLLFYELNEALSTSPATIVNNDIIIDFQQIEGTTEKSFEIPLKLNTDYNYLFKITNNVESDSFEILSQNVSCQVLNNPGSNTMEKGEYFIYLSSLSTVEYSESVIKFEAKSSGSIKGTITISPLKAIEPTWSIFSNYGSSLGFAINCIQKLDKLNIYNYMLDIPDSQLIMDPLSPESFFNTNHIYNAYTIGNAKLRMSDNQEIIDKDSNITILDAR